MEELKQVDEDEVHLLFWWKVNEGKGHYGKLKCAWGAIRLEIELDALCIFGDVKYLIWHSSILLAVTIMTGVT